MDFDITIRESGPYLVAGPTRKPSHCFELDFIFSDIPDMDAESYHPGSFKKDVVNCIRWVSKLSPNEASVVYHTLRESLVEVLCNSLDAGATHMTARLYTLRPAATLHDAAKLTYRVDLYDDGHGFINIPIHHHRSLRETITDSFAEEKAKRIGGCKLALRQMLNRLDTFERKPISILCNSYLIVRNLLDHTKSKRRGARITLGMNTALVLNKEEYNHICVSAESTPLSQAVLPSTSPSPCELSPVVPSRSITPDEAPSDTSNTTVFQALTVMKPMTNPLEKPHFG